MHAKWMCGRAVTAPGLAAALAAMALLAASCGGGGGGSSGPPCFPSCAGLACGDDGCGGSCGACAGGQACDPYGQCHAACSRAYAEEPGPNPTPPVPALTGHVLDVTAYGAVPDDGLDDRAGLAAAFGAIAPGDTVLLPPGRYDVDVSGGPFFLGVLGVHDVEVSAEGARLQVGGFDVTRPYAGALLGVQASTDVLVHGLSVDYTRLPYSVGVVTANPAFGVVTLAIDPAYPITAAPRVEAVMDLARGTLAPAGARWDLYADDAFPVTLVGPQRIDLTYGVGQPITVGTPLLLRHNEASYVAIFVGGCARVGFRDVSIHASAGIAVAGEQNTDLHFSRVTVAPPAGELRPMSSTADGLHLSTNAGTVTVEDSLFERLGDDAMNVNGAWIRVAGAADANVVLERAPPGWRTGDVIELRDQHLALLGSAVLAAPPDGVTLALDRPVPGIGPGTVATDRTYLPALRVTGTTVRSSRARGILVQTSPAVIDRCTFESTTGPGVQVTTDLDRWYESGPADGVLVQRSVFRAVNKSTTARRGALSIFADMLGRVPAPAGVHRNVRVLDNDFVSVGGAGVWVSSADGVTLAGNSFLGSPAVVEEESRNVVNVCYDVP